MAENTISFFDQLRQAVSYDPETGIMRWLPRPRESFSRERCWKTWNTRYAGTEAFAARSNGYKVGRFGGKGCYAHRMAWAFVHSEFPVEIDHINGDRTDNRLCNLRDVGHELNLRNCKTSISNTSGATGVTWDKARGRWSAYIGDGTKTGLKLGRFTNIEDAIKARKEAEINLQYHANHGR